VRRVIGYIEGKLLQRSEERILVLAGGVGWEILLPAVVMASIQERPIGDPIALHIFFYQTERQPRPVLIGFNQALEKDFFQQFISVEDIGPLKAAKALTLPVAEIARAVEEGDMRALRRLKGIGERTASKIVASLAGKLQRYLEVLPAATRSEGGAVREAIAQRVLEVLVEQLGHRPPDARRMIAEAFQRNAAIGSPEELFDEVYRGERAP
jgi:Holliday junction DNA helicase RuvA